MKTKNNQFENKQEGVYESAWRRKWEHYVIIFSKKIGILTDH